MGRPMPMENKKWPEIKMLIQQGNEGYYVEKSGFVDIILPDALVQCQMPTVAQFDGLPNDFKELFNRKHCEEFEGLFKPIMLRSKLSDPA